MAQPFPLLACAAAMTMLSSSDAEAQSVRVLAGLQVSSNNVERGLSTSLRDAALSAHAGLSHQSGLSATVAIATVSNQVYVGSDGYKIAPEISWSTRFGPEQEWRAGVSLLGQIYPGARGPWSGSLPLAGMALTQLGKDSDYSTVEVSGTLGWRNFTLSVSRSLTDYLGIASVQSTLGSTRTLGSVGTTYWALDADWPLSAATRLTAGLGRLHVANFEPLGYTDWRLGVTTQALGTEWGMQATGSNARDAWEPRRPGATSGASSSKTTGKSLRVWAAWSL